MVNYYKLKWSEKIFKDFFRPFFYIPNYSIIQISPPEPSFIIFVRVSWSLNLASSGILPSLPLKPSFTSSWSDLPKMFVSHIDLGFSSNSFRRKCTSSSDCFSVPTMGDTSVSMSALIICIISSKTKSLIVFCFMMCIIADIWQFVEWLFENYSLNFDTRKIKFVY